MARFDLSPSRLARFTFLECERFLRFDAASASTRREEGLPARELDRSPVTQAVLASGAAWEEHVLASHLAGRAVVAEATSSDQRLSDRHLGYERTVRELRSLAPGRVLYQPTLRAPAPLYGRYGLDPELVMLTDARPDLVQCVEGDDGPELRVVDLKASDAMHLSHRIQVGIYTLILDAMLEAEGLADRFQRSRIGGVWRYGLDAPEWFPLSSILPPIETFLADDLGPLLESAPEQAFWHLDHRCEWCDFLSHCRPEAEARGDVSLLPYLSHFGKRHLAARGVDTLDGLAEALERDDADELLRGAASLEGRRSQLALAVDALRSGQVRETGAASVAMPRGEGVRLVLTLQRDPLSGDLFGYAVERLFGGAVFGEARETIARVAEDGSPPALADLRHQLVTDLLGILRPVHEHNLANADDWWSQLSVQAYVYDGYERELLVDALLRVVEEGDDLAAIEDALTLLFHFQHPDLAALDQQPAKELVFPVVVLTDVVRQVVALPIPVTYRLADVTRVLLPSEHGFELRHHDGYDHELSNRMRADAVLRLWAEGDADARAARLEKLTQQLRLRVWGANSIVNGLRERLGDALFSYPPKLELPEALGFADPMLSRLAFITRYEAVLAYLDQRQRRMRPQEERLARGDTLELEAIGGGWYRLHPRHAEHPIERGFWDHLLTVDDEPGRRARLQFDDFRYRARVWPPKRLAIALANVVEQTEDGRVRLELRESDAFTEPPPGTRCSLEPRYTDWTSRHVEPELRELDATPDARFTRLVDDPLATRRDLPVAPSVGTVARALANQHGMTGSQRRAFAGLVAHDTQLVWGPPGTGKTHFLALAVLALAEAHRRNDAPFTVLVTAFTHTAIDNLLAKIAELQDDLGIYDGDVPIRKLATHDRGGTIPAVAPKDAAGFVTERPIAIVGGTVWQVRKIEPSRLVYDLVVVDEGSQVRVAEAAIPIRRLAPDGRLLVAGDDRQLPPIVAGRYPEEPGEPLLHRSILECLRDRAGDGDAELTAPLVENWRMNAALCAYPASSIYPASYAPASHDIATRRIDDVAADDDLTRALLSPDHPVTVAILEDVRATAESRAEAALVADLAVALRDGAPDLDDHAFWRERLFVVSPHHAQIRAIRRALAGRWDGDARPFVDTVDKMQGQEADVVIVSYGVADVEYALREREFIYSLNRLNVAVTRARAKAVVLLSRALLDPPVQALADERVAEGIAFMQGLATHTARTGETLRLAREGLGRVTVVRA